MYFHADPDCTIILSTYGYLAFQSIRIYELENPWLSTKSSLLSSQVQCAAFENELKFTLALSVHVASAAPKDS